MTTTHTVPQGAVAAALSTLPAGALTDVVKTSSNYVYFDLIGFIDDQLMQGEMKARVSSSMAWMLDMRIVNYARQVFFETYRESMETGSIDAFNEFTRRMNEVIAGGEHTEEVGFVNVSAFTQLVSLLNMRKFWHDFAGKHATRAYEPKTLTELVMSEKLRETTIDSKAKIEMRARFAANGDAAMETKLFEMLLAKSNQSLAQQHELRQKLNPAVLRIIQIASNKAQFVYDDECPPFHELPIDVQRSLIEASIGAVERALADMANLRSVTLDDYAIAIKEAASYQAEVKKVLAAPKFVAQ